MTTFLIWLLMFELLAMVAWGLVQRQRALEYPFLVAVGFTGYLLPQFIGLSQMPDLPDQSLNKTLVMAVLCLLASHLGYTMNRRPAVLFRRRKFDRQSLVIASAILTLIGAYFFYQISLLSAEVSLRYGGAWTGIITVYVFLSQLVTIGLVIALVVHLRRPDWSTFLIVCVGVMLFLDRIVMHGRRSAAIEFFVIVTLSLWFTRRWAPPRWIVISGVVVGVLAVNSIGAYRSTMLERDRTTWTGAGISEILGIDYLGNLKRNFEEPGGDVINAVYRIEAVDRSLKLDYWLSIYDAFINNFVPAQFVGIGFKHSLMLDIGSSDYGESRHVPQVGSTETGLADAFGSFWYFGLIKFFLIGLILSRWYKAAVRGSVTAEIIVILVMYPALLSFPFDTNKFFLEFVSLTLFLLPALVLTGRKSAQFQSGRRYPWLRTRDVAT
jgi:hypothetical protein